MRSYRQTLQNSWIKTAISPATLARKLKFPASASVNAMLEKLVTEPATIDFNSDVVTGGLSGLGGRVTLTFNSDNTYKVHFHMWNTSKATGYDYSVRAIFTASNGMMFVSMHSGHVGAEDVIGSAAEDDYEETGIHPLLYENWPDILGGSMYETHEYSASGGPLGELEDLAKEIAIIYTGGLAAGAVGSALGMTMALTKEAGKVFGGLGESVAVIGGVVVFNIGIAAGASVTEALFLATVAGIAAGAVTDLALVQQRPIYADEYNFANAMASGGSNYPSGNPGNNSVFMGQLPPMDKLRITNLCSPDKGRAFTIRGVDGLTYLNMGAAHDHLLDEAGNQPYAKKGQLLVHELVHAMQIDHGNTWGVICSGIVNQTKNYFVDDVYKFGDAGPDWHSSYFNNESRAALVDHWFGGESKDDGKPMDPASPYYKYITQNVRTGDMGNVDI